MIRRMKKHLGAAVCAAFCIIALLVGCSAGTQTNEEANRDTANRQYLSSVSEVISELTGELDEFIDAVSEGDLVTMRLEASDASKVIDELDSLSAPEDLHDAHDAYVDGCTLLQQALDDYVQLYSDVESAGGSLENNTYTDRLSAAQQLYDAGIAKLTDADETAASLISAAESSTSSNTEQ